MPATIEDVARSFLAAVDLKAQIGPELAGRWIRERYKEMVGRTQFRHLRRRFTIYVPAPYTTGIATVNQGSNVVTGIGTAFDSIHIGWFFRAMNVWIRVTNVNIAAQTLTLESPYSETSTGSPVTFYLLQRYIPLDPSIRWIGEVTHPRRRKRLNQRSETFLDYKHPSRMLVGPFPYCWAEAPASMAEQGIITPTVGNPANANDRRKWIEVYPPSITPEQFDYVGWTIPQNLELEDVLPQEIDEYVLREGVLEDFWRSRIATELSKDVPSAEIIQQLSLIAARQHTIWETCIENAIIADRTNQDVEVTVGVENEWDFAEEDIIDAHDQVYSQWPN